MAPPNQPSPSSMFVAVLFRFDELMGVAVAATASMAARRSSSLPFSQKGTSRCAVVVAARFGRSFLQPARFVWLHDQTMDCAAIAGLKVRGDHGGLLRSSAAFLDGHVEYIESVPDEWDTARYTLKAGRVFAPAGL